MGPVAGTRLADTGGLAVGNYSVLVLVGASANVDCRLRRRNAADAADVWSQRFVCDGSSFSLFSGRFSFLQGERLVVENINTIASTIQASIFATID